MTDPRSPETRKSEPRTAAGRAALDRWFDVIREDVLRDAILAIEAEASSSDELRAAAEAVRATLRPVPPNAGRIGFLVAPGQGRAFELAAGELVAALHASRLDADKEGEG